MQELIMNFQKHGKWVPMPKIYMDEDNSESKGLELEDGTKVGQNARKGNKRSLGDGDNDCNEGPSEHRKSDPAPQKGRHLMARKEL